MTHAEPEPPIPEELEWAVSEASRQLVPLAPGWFRAWPKGDEKWAAVNIRGCSQVIVNHSREDDRHPNRWTVRAMVGDRAVELRLGPYPSQAQAIWVAQAVLSLALS
jgi:hypothetical protein